MQTTQIVLEQGESVGDKLLPLAASKPSLVFAFGAPSFFKDHALMTQLSHKRCGATWLGCSTAGEINQSGVSANSLVITAVSFSGSVPLRSASVLCPDMSFSFEAGRLLAERLPSSCEGEPLQGVFLLSPGVDINGSEVIAGARSVLAHEVKLSGGLAGDDAAFACTYTLLNGVVSDRSLVAVAFYGDQMQYLTGSYGGWRSFGPVRTVTRARGNVLFEMDGEPALEIYKRYLGDYAAELPGSGLLFPLAILDRHDGEAQLIRTLIGIDEAEGSMTFAGDIPEGGFVRLMQASVNALVDGAQTAAETASSMLTGDQPGLALLVSCVGRKLMMAGRTEEEVEAVSEAFGSHVSVTGFYSHGEISPDASGTDCHLHNQTMTITYLSDA